MSDAEIRVAHDNELGTVALLASEVFDEFIAPFYSPEGREEFHRYAATQALRERNRADHVTLIARKEGQVIGMLHLRQGRHVAMLFVHRAHQRGGVGRKLVNVAAELSLSRGCSACQLTVNSSPNAVEAYRRLGFLLLGPEQVAHGIRFFPMQLEFSHNRLVGPAAPPNGGPAGPLANPGVLEGPPSVS